MFHDNNLFQDVARKNINELLGNIELKYGECAVRVNSVDSGLVPDDIEAALTGKILPESLLLPKVESSDHIKWVNTFNAHFILILFCKFQLFSQLITQILSWQWQNNNKYKLLYLRRKICWIGCPLISVNLAMSVDRR